MALTPEEIEKRIRDSYELSNKVITTVPAPLISIRTSTYQHGPYIKECIEGVLMQETAFPIELIIGEDFSTDGTREIVFEYAHKYPDIIRVITADYNVGMTANGTRCIRACRGKYMAICEGDDFWIDPYKLQKQVDFLEAHPEYGLVHTDNSGLSQSTGLMVHSHKESYYPEPPDGSVFEKLLIKNFISSLTVVVRKDILMKALNNMATFLSHELMFDYAIWIEVSRLTKLKYFNDITAVYRISDGTASRPDDDYRKSLFYKKRYDLVRCFMEKYGVSDGIRYKFYHDFFKTYLSNIRNLNSYYRFNEKELNTISFNDLKFKILKHFYIKKFPKLFSEIIWQLSNCVCKKMELK